MKDGYPYTIIFTFVVTAILTTILAVANAYYQPVIEENEALLQKRAILYVLDNLVDDSQIDQVFTESIREETLHGLTVFAQLDEEQQVIAYAVPLKGAGLWGTIRGYVGISANLDQILGIEFTEQNETPGLGGRIDEEWYKEQFRGVQMDGSVPVFQDDNGDLLVDDITGATSTSNAVRNILRESMAQALSVLEVEL